MASTWIGVLAMYVRGFSFDGIAHIALSGNFDDKSVRAFRLGCESAVTSSVDTRVEVDLSEAS